MHLRPSALTRPGRLLSVIGLGLVVLGSPIPGLAQAQQSGPAGSDAAEAADAHLAATADENFNDPFENTNRKIFDFNQDVDRIILVPVAKGYRAVLPAPVRDSLHDFLRNLDEPIIFANDVLQARPDLASKTFARFMINTTIGIGGLFDVATHLKVPFHDNDLGITFAVWGIRSGPYIILPILGPSTVRDAIGQGADNFGDPGNIIASNYNVLWATFARAGVDGIDTRSRNIESLADIERTSLDYYATIRSLYRQRRAAEIRHEPTSVPNLSPVGGGGTASPPPPISYTVAPGHPPAEAPYK